MSDKPQRRVLISINPVAVWAWLRRLKELLRR